MPPVKALALLALVALPASADMPRAERVALREEVRDLFTHAWDQYMAHAFPRDVLLPLSCKGADSWGGITLTVLDTLDTLAIMGNASEFERMVNWCVAHIDFDQDETVSVFETNIRALGGLLSAHLLAIDPRLNLMTGPYDAKGGLLTLALDLGRRLLPALQTDSGIPFGSINLRRGVASTETPVTCTAAAGTLLLEFGLLSRLSGDPAFEAAAHAAAIATWGRRSELDLLGAHINLRTGAWTQQDAGIGRGVDSFYEYMLKAHMLFGGTAAGAQRAVGPA